MKTMKEKESVSSTPASVRKMTNFSPFAMNANFASMIRPIFESVYALVTTKVLQPSVLLECISILSIGFGSIQFITNALSTSLQPLVSIERENVKQETSKSAKHTNSQSSQPYSLQPPVPTSRFQIVDLVIAFSLRIKSLLETPRYAENGSFCEPLLEALSRTIVAALESSSQTFFSLGRAMFFGFFLNVNCFPSLTSISQTRSTFRVAKSSSFEWTPTQKMSWKIIILVLSTLAPTSRVWSDPAMTDFFPPTTMNSTIPSFRYWYFDEEDSNSLSSTGKKMTQSSSSHAGSSLVVSENNITTKLQALSKHCSSELVERISSIYCLRINESRPSTEINATEKTPFSLFSLLLYSSFALSCPCHGSLRSKPHDPWEGVALFNILFSILQTGHHTLSSQFQRFCEGLSRALRFFLERMKENTGDNNSFSTQDAFGDFSSLLNEFTKDNIHSISEKVLVILSTMKKMNFIPIDALFAGIP